MWYFRTPPFLRGFPHRRAQRRALLPFGLVVFTCLGVAFDLFTLGITLETLLYVKQGRIVILYWVLDMFRVLLRVLICSAMQGRVSEVSQAFHVSRACECFRVLDCAG